MRRMMRTPPQWGPAPVVIVMATLLCLAGCGGSNGDTAADDATDVPTPPTTTAATNTAPPPDPPETVPDPPTTAPAEPPGRMVFQNRWFFTDRSPQLIALHDKPAPRLFFNGWLGDETQAAELETMIGRAGDLSRLEGKIVVLYVWTVHSRPCLKALERTNEFIERFRDEDVVFITLHLPNADRAQIQAAMSTYGATFPTAFDVPGDTPETAGQGKTEATWGLNLFPAHILIDERGIVRAAGVLTSKVQEGIEVLIEERTRFGGDGPQAG